MLSIRLFCSFSLLIMVLAISSEAQARKGVLRRADAISFRADYPEEARKKVRAALTQPGIKFLEGHWVTIHSSLKFAGDAKSLGKLLQSLSDCPGTTLKVSFQSLDHDADWVLIHFTQSNQFSVIVNSKSKRIKVEDLAIPQIHGPKLTEPKASTEK